MAALRPQRVRLVLDWALLQPDRRRPAQLAEPQDGCMRGTAPCAPYAGVREQLQAIASQGRSGRAPGVVPVVQHVPEWAARGARGCERRRAEPRARPLRPEALEAYRALVRDVTALAAEVGAKVERWSPWNEPNHPAFISPQRGACAPDGRPLAPEVYAQLARAAREALPAGVGLLLGDFAGYQEPTPYRTTMEEFVAALPDDVACAPGTGGRCTSTSGRGARPGSAGTVPEATRTRSRRSTRSSPRARARRRRPSGSPRRARATSGRGGTAPAREADLRAGCRQLARILRRWDATPRVDGVFQYTVREDPLYPVGLADAGLTRTYPAADLLAAWAATTPGEAPPGPEACRAR